MSHSMNADCYKIIYDILIDASFNDLVSIEAMLVDHHEYIIEEIVMPKRFDCSDVMRHLIVSRRMLLIRECCCIEPE